ncbi:MAG: phosphoribosylformylglycinamidine cyclo-ligase [Euryarchaeota archaeon]|nr:phosphoribosylformylglycinamidine cyclo-ligase [Euryarchaeota archaeon]MAI40560.1 phosphoribosylformylglycinamidine cyclo-ligase [Euryarchaeota archaeon]MDP6234706.1 phosphoribosylformylglycinamidine cyclo-ligase [Candidatus Poseidoniaceae archaeon]|tara:strand:+ start:276 stop:1400 length:1125 start_codon:yes stop_codon:yes gene_type:complete
MAEPMDYASAGVDIDLEGSAVASLIASLSASSRPAGTPGAPVHLPGGFGGLIEFGDSLLALATDGVGSKLQIASALKQWGGVGIDCMAMNVNDLLCVGAEPIAFVDYVAVPKPDPETHAALGASLAEACRQARVTLAGGETASLPGIVNELDLSGTALGYVKKGQAITGEHLKSGDVLIGLPSSGIHSNGYSLVRRVMEHTGHQYTDKAPFNVPSIGRTVMHFDGNDDQQFTLGEVFLNPTRIYCDPIIDMLQYAETDGAQFQRSDVRAICHITGGGLSNLLRLHESLGWHIDSPLPPHPEFDWLQSVGGIETREMYRTFNMGTGMILAVSSDKAEQITAWLEERMLGTKIIGHVHDQGHKVTHALEGVEFSHY